MVIDSHVLLWWLTDAGKLSTRAGDFLTSCEAGEQQCVLAGVSLWELEHKRRKGRLPLANPVRTWLPKLQALEFVKLTGTSLDLWLSAAELAWTHRDPADRLIAATALARGVSVLTKDRRFHAPDAPVSAVW